MSTLEIRQYQTLDGRTPFGEWLDGLRDGRARARVVARIDRMQAGLRGDWKSVGRGVFELRIDCGPGYRIYCGQDRSTVILLLLGGDKRTQERDIELAHVYWQDYKTRSAQRSIQRRALPPQ